MEFRFKIFSQAITGLATLTRELTLSLSIEKATKGEIIYFVYPSYVIKGDPANFYIVFQNTGNQNLTEKIEVYIKDSEDNILASFHDENKTLEPLEMKSFFVTWDTSNLGTYQIFVEVPYDGQTERLNRSFEVISKEALPVYYPIYTYLPAAPPIIPAIVNLTLLYPKQINLTQNESFLIYIYAINFGNIDLRNLSLSAEVEGIEWDVEPKSLSVLPTRSSFIFLLGIRVPPGAESGDYSLKFEVRSDKTKQTGSLTVTVSPIEMCPEVERAIKNYALLIDKISAEVEKAASQGRNVTLASHNLEKAKLELETAKELYLLNDCKGAKNHLELLKYHLEKAVIELTKTVPVPFPYFTLIRILLIAFVFIIIFLAMMKKKFKKYQLPKK
jgi:hypothetical protein